MIGTFLYSCALGALICGCILASFSNEANKKRQIGWLIMSIGALMLAIKDFYCGYTVSGCLMLGIFGVDFGLHLYWRNEYKKEQLKRLSNKERFIKEIMERKIK